jgi:hypothetical protein
MVRLQFVCERAFSSQLIAWFSQGHFSHVDASVGNHQLLGARIDRPDGQKSGVRIRPFGYSEFSRRTVFSIPATPSQEAAWRIFLYSQVDRPYDWRAILAFAANRNWRERDSWICSELQAAALEEAGILPKLYLAAHKITPVALALAVSAIPGTTWVNIRC